MSVTFVGVYELVYCGAVRLNIFTNVLKLKDILESCRVDVAVVVLLFDDFSDDDPRIETFRKQTMDK